MSLPGQMDKTARGKHPHEHPSPHPAKGLNGTEHWPKGGQQQITNRKMESRKKCSKEISAR